MLKALKLGQTNLFNVVSFAQDLVHVASASNSEVASRIVSIWNIGHVDNAVKPTTAELDYHGTCLHVGPPDEVVSLSFSPNADMLACACGGEFSEVHCICVWATGSWIPIVEPLNGHTASIRAMAWSPSSSVLASGSDDSSIRIWSITSGQQLCAPLQGHTGKVHSLHFNNSGTLLCSASGDCTVKIWSTADGLPQATLLGHSQAVLAVAWRPDGQVLASGSQDKTARLWSLESGQCLSNPLSGHTDSILSVAWCPTVNCVATGSEDRKVWLWSGSTGLPIMGPLCLHVSQISIQMPVLTGHLVKVLQIAFDPNGNRLASADASGVVIVWDVLRTEDRLAVAMATHPRLGECSPLSLLQPETLALIADLVSTEAASKMHDDEEGSPWLDSPYSVASSGRGSSSLFVQRFKRDEGPSAAKRMTFKPRK